MIILENEVDNSEIRDDDAAVFGQMRMKIFLSQTQLKVRICSHYVSQYSAWQTNLLW